MDVRDWWAQNGLANGDKKSFSATELAKLSGATWEKCKLFLEAHIHRLKSRRSERVDAAHTTRCRAAAWPESL